MPAPAFVLSSWIPPNSLALHLINPYGIEVTVDRAGWQAIVQRGEAHLFKKAPYGHEGKGPANKVCLLLNDNGIGDAIHAMPAIVAKVQAGFDVSVMAEERFRTFYEPLGVTFIPTPPVTQGWMREHSEEYGYFYSLKNWCINHDEETHGAVTRDRFDQMADYLSVKCPDSFNFKQYLGHSSPTANIPSTRVPAKRRTKKSPATKGD